MFLILAFDFDFFARSSKKAFFRVFCEKTLRAALAAASFRAFGETMPRTWPGVMPPEATRLPRAMRPCAFFRKKRLS
ncbi:hypothetical protein [Candidatus Magnetaquiglobus chichijimensis]|uniref:hypothetical protein n=1 Tax=Candidatus Magnetaquiglobus chichijimensis TaxID=3141448 RepID=UPI003B973132